MSQNYFQSSSPAVKVQNFTEFHALPPMLVAGGFLVTTVDCYRLPRPHVPITETEKQQVFCRSGGFTVEVQVTGGLGPVPRV